MTHHQVIIRKILTDITILEYSNSHTHQQLDEPYCEKPVKVHHWGRSQHGLKAPLSKYPELTCCYFRKGNEQKVKFDLLCICKNTKCDKSDEKSDLA